VPVGRNPLTLAIRHVEPATFLEVTDLQRNIPPSETTKVKTCALVKPDTFRNLVLMSKANNVVDVQDQRISHTKIVLPFIAS